MIFEYKDLTEIEGIIYNTDIDGNVTETTGMVLSNPTSDIIIEDGLELRNPKMEIVSVFYNLKTNEFSIEVYFWESKKVHSRNFNTVNAVPGSLTMEAVMAFVGTHPILSLFTPIV